MDLNRDKRHVVVAEFKNYGTPERAGGALPSGSASFGITPPEDTPPRKLLRALSLAEKKQSGNTQPITIDEIPFASERGQR
jgi:hypothetical protein